MNDQAVIEVNIDGEIQTFLVNKGEDPMTVKPELVSGHQISISLVQAHHKATVIHKVE